MLGIRKTRIGHLYRQARVGQNLFYKIHEIVTKASERTQLKCISSKNLITVNLRKQANKIQPFQQYIIDKNIDICAIRETWIKRMTLTWLLNRFHLLDMISCNIHAWMEEVEVD